MGYRSDIRIFTNKQGFKLFEDVVISSDLAYPLMGHGKLPDYYKELGHKEVVFGWDWIKWDNYYNDIEPIELMIQELLQQEDIPIHVIRIGKDYSDIEERFNETGIQSSPMYVERCVNFLFRFFEKNCLKGKPYVCN